MTSATDVAAAAIAQPSVKPVQPSFSSGPCPKRPGWTLESVAARAMLGRSHRAKPLKAQLKDAIDRTKALLGCPEDYLVGIVPGSDTGAEPGTYARSDTGAFADELRHQRISRDDWRGVDECAGGL